MLQPSTKFVLLAAILIGLALTWYPYAVPDMESHPLAVIGGLLTTLAAAGLSIVVVVRYLVQRRPDASYESAGWTALLVFGSTVMTIRLFTDVPTWLTGLAISPALVIPLVLERLRHPFPKTIAAGTNRELPTYSLDQEFVIIDRAVESEVVKAFLERYPNCDAYLYQEATWDRQGGVLLANRDRMHLPGTIYLDVTLVCPFGANLGQFLLGQERVQSYFYRQEPQGDYFSFMPKLRWEEWLEGMSKVNWFVKIREVHHVPRSDVTIGDLPFMLVAEDWRWKKIELRRREERVPGTNPDRP